MSRSESFAIGVAMITVALAVLTGSRRAAWVLLAIGLVLVAYPYVLDLVYGKFRPTQKEINDMSLGEYDKHLSDRRFQRWVNHLPKPRNRPTRPS